MSYQNINRSTTFSVSATKLADLVFLGCRNIANYLDSILTTEMGFIRADTKDTPDPSTGVSQRDTLYANMQNSNYYVFDFHYINVYKDKEVADNFLLCDVQYFQYSGSSANSLNAAATRIVSDNRLSHKQVVFQITLSYSKTNIANDYLRNSTSNGSIQPNSGTATSINLPYNVIQNYIVSSPAVGLTFISGDSSSSLWNLDLKLRQIKTNDCNFLILNDETNMAPQIGTVKINNQKYPVINKMSSCSSQQGEQSSGYPTIYYTANTADISYFFCIMGEEYKVLLGNFLRAFEFRNNKSKMPILPVYLSTSDNTSSTSYDFSKPIQGLFQTAKNFAVTRGVKYVLDNVSYVSLGNNFLLEEGPILQNENENNNEEEEENND